MLTPIEERLLNGVEITNGELREAFTTPTIMAASQAHAVGRRVIREQILELAVLFNERLIPGIRKGLTLFQMVSVFEYAMDASVIAINDEVTPRNAHAFDLREYLNDISEDDFYAVMGESRETWLERIDVKARRERERAQQEDLDRRPASVSDPDAFG